MIHYLVTADHDYTLRWFLRDCTPADRPQTRIWHYERQPWRRGLPPGAYVFTDLERLRDSELARAAELHSRLLAAGPGYRVLNDPARTLRRYDLLRALADRGWNPFRVFRATESLEHVRFPVFLRFASRHDGNLTSLLADHAALKAALARFRGDAADVLVVEFHDSAGADGLYRKYSVFRVGTRLLPRHVFFSRDWMQKYADLVEPELVDEELRFFESLPHVERLREIFDLAGVDYGRIDYSAGAAGVVTWEINTNPMLAQPLVKTAPARVASQRVQSERLARSIGALDRDLPASVPVSAFERRWVDLVSSLRKKVTGVPGLRRLRRP